MNGKEAISKLMNIKEGEGPTIMLLMIFSFFLGIGIAFYYTATTSLFLVNFEREILPFAYIGGGTVVYLLSLLFAKFQKRVKVSGFLVTALMFLFLSVAILVALYLNSGNRWIALVLFIWMRVFAYIQGFSFWGLASRIFNLEQGKRHFGLISAGEVISNILSFFSVPFLLRIINTEDLLFLSLTGLGLSMIFMVWLVRRYSDKLSTKNATKAKDKSLEKKSQNLFKDKYFSLIFILAFVPMLANFIVDFIFLTQTKEIFIDKEVLSGFIGIFFGVTSIVEFISKTFVSGRIIKDHGIKAGLPSLPLLLAFSTVLAILAGIIFGPAGIFFSFIILGKLFMRAIRTSIYEPSFQILFQPVPKDMRLAFLSKIEGGPKAFGNIIAGFILLVFTSFGFFTLVHFNILLLIIIAYWLHSSLKMTAEYRRILSNLVSGGAKRRQVLAPDFSVFEIIKSGLNTSNPFLFRLLIRLSDLIDPSEKIEMLPLLFEKSDVAIQTTILAIIRERRISELKSFLEKYTNENFESPLQNDLQETIEFLSATADVTIDEIEELIKSNDQAKKVDAAILLGKSRRYHAARLLNDLCKDDNPIVKSEALRCAAFTNNRETRTIIVKNLAKPAFSLVACSSAKKLGKRIIDDLVHFYTRSEDDRSVRLKILQLFEEIGGTQSEKFLRSQINSTEKSILDKSLDALCKLKYTARSTEKPIIKRIIDEEIANIVYLNASLSDLQSIGQETEITKALNYEIHTKREKIFNLLSVLYDPDTIGYIRDVLSEESKEAHVFALEIMGMVLSDDIKIKVLPIFEDLKSREIISKYRNIFPQEVLSIQDRLCDLINRNAASINDWTRSNAIRQLEEYSTSQAELVLAANILHPDLIIRDTALRTLFKLNTQKFDECIRLLDTKDRKKIFEITNEILSGSSNRNIYILEKIRSIKQIPFLTDVPEPLLLSLVINSEKKQFRNGERIEFKSKYIFLIINGKVKLTLNGLDVDKIGHAGVIGEISVIYLREPGVRFFADSQVVALKIPLNDLFDLMISHKYINKSFVRNLMSELSENVQPTKSENDV